MEFIMKRIFITLLMALSLATIQAGNSKKKKNILTVAPKENTEKTKLTAEEAAEKNENNHLLQIPEEVLAHIGSYLSQPKDLINRSSSSC